MCMYKSIYFLHTYLNAFIYINCIKREYVIIKERQSTVKVYVCLW